MAHKFLEQTFTPGVLAAQRHYYGAAQNLPPAPGDDVLGDEEIHFIEARDSLYLASVGETGWPYLQHRGGPPGFCKIVGRNLLAFADFRGNRQMLTTGNLGADDRVCLFLMDYPKRERLKLQGHAEVLDAREHPDLAATLAPPGLARVTERIFRIRIVSFDWNCPKFITPRFTAPEIAGLVQPLKDHIAELEARLAKVGHEPT